MGLAALVGVFATTDRAEAAQCYSFAVIPSNDSNPVDANIGEQQQRMCVEQANGDLTRFTFTNLGPEQMTIARIYWDDDDGVLGSIQSVTGAGTDFSVGGAPPNVPRGNTINFDADFRVTANPPPPQDGINPTETLSVVFAGTNFANVLQSLQQAVQDPFTSGGLRVATHVINFASGGSEAFVVIPLPAAAWLMLAGLGGLGLAARRRRQVAA